MYNRDRVLREPGTEDEGWVAYINKPLAATKVPDVPDQSEFCNMWFDYHRGYCRRRIVEDGNVLESTEALSCEVPWRDTPPGYLPLRHQPQLCSEAIAAVTSPSSTPHISIEDALDAMMEDSDQENEQLRPPAQEANSTSENSLPAANRPSALVALPSGDQADEVQKRLDEALDRKRRITEELTSAETELRLCREQHRQITSAQQRMRNFERVFGSREEIQQQGDAYQSPVSAMFERAYGWFQTAEEVRAAERNSNRQEQQYEQLLSSIEEPWLRRTLNNARRQADEESPPVNHQPNSLDDERVPRPPPKEDAEMSYLRALIAFIGLGQQVLDTSRGHFTACPLAG
ncbi:MAG: hypothetical protein Q9159_006938 [Coniocarpon cinnabarinum]